MLIKNFFLLLNIKIKFVSVYAFFVCLLLFVCLYVCSGGARKLSPTEVWTQVATEKGLALQCFWYNELLATVGRLTMVTGPVRRIQARLVSWITSSLAVLHIQRAPIPHSPLPHITIDFECALGDRIKKLLE